MTSQGVMRAGTSGLNSHGGKLSKQIFKIATVPSTVESECIAVLSCLLEAVEANEDPSSFQRSCTGLQTFESPKINTNRPLSSGHASKKRSVDLVVIRVVSLGVVLTVKEIWSFSFTIFQMEKNVQSKDLRKKLDRSYGPQRFFFYL